MSVTYATFVARFPEFTTADAGEQARITTFISDATLDVDSDSWGTKQDLGISYLAAHMLAMANRTKDAGSPLIGSGALQEAKVGQLTAKFAQPASGTTPFPLMGLSSTPYGMEFARIRSTLSITPLTI